MESLRNAKLECRIQAKLGFNIEYHGTGAVCRWLDAKSGAIPQEAESNPGLRAQNLEDAYEHVRHHGEIPFTPQPVVDWFVQQPLFSRAGRCADLYHALSSWCRLSWCRLIKEYGLETPGNSQDHSA